ncbi:MAG: efflux RND transporter periplasmic adaptor subunit [Phycisphaeraceae bacterium]|nr:efflux RND transporter periplasmic adaptor subunit [Phycisphaeraceae bacterium]
MTPPRRRWIVRWGVPLAVTAAVLALLGYAARQTLRPSIEVELVEVVARPAALGAVAGGSRAMTVQAPGWVEPDPYPSRVTALAEGVVTEVLVLEGQHVEAGQVVARLVDADAQLAARRAGATVETRKAEVARAMAAERVETARAAELSDDLDRKRPLVERGAVGQAEFRQLELRLAGQEAMVAAAGAQTAQARAALAEAEAALAEADLRLTRMVVRSPWSGVVLARIAEPGSRLMMNSDDRDAATIVKLYDPARLRVRVDIPLADAGKVAIGHEAEVTTEALPGVVLRGVVALFVHEANIQKNTVQVKVILTGAPPELKPEMLTRVRFFRPASTAPAGTGPGGSTDDELWIFVPEASIADADGRQPFVWLFDEPSRTAVRRDVRPEPGATDGYRRIAEGLRPGDRVIVRPPAGLTSGAAVRPAPRRTGETRP